MRIHENAHRCILVVSCIRDVNINNSDILLPDDFDDNFAKVLKNIIKKTGGPTLSC